MLVVGVPDADDGKGAAYVFSITSEGVQLEEEIAPFRSSTTGFGSFVQFEHVDDAGWWLCVASVHGETYSTPIGRWF